ncbi:nucleotidyltransferase family protein [Reichenbachiella ulvae]|uniref:Nucleotidyltransferase family protein n=1 Tax=Reichenbachiella ulvae TaxID=2980104 RepID=A0ABT3CR97_9BACT|nr:nucleotidyltransferase family protein [Reichenbachiella ulvae]MCV9386010.1 nucleotidyltransferase family protein [Reichenbachiella ulvae]
MPKQVILILAAGNSSRLGQPKQMLPLSDEANLLQHTVQVAMDSLADDIVVVLGSNAGEHDQMLDQWKDQLHIIQNDQWQKGMGSSIKAGVKCIDKEISDWGGVLISVCDQPHLRTKIIDQLIQEGEKCQAPVASQYDPDNFGVPVWFPKSWQSQLEELPDERGALFLLKQIQSELFTLPFPEGETDIDTLDDWKEYLATNR